MSHWAQLDENNVVLQVLVGDDTNGEEAAGVFFQEIVGGTWVQCSYNHRICKQFPGIGYRYCAARDIFITPQPFPSWTETEEGDWEAPTPKPTDGRHCAWDEATLSWLLVLPPDPV